MTGATAYVELQQPDVYPDATSQVEVCETHISWVYLTDQHAYKIKKPLDLGFLDFSTLEQRQFFCEQEVALNRRLSTDVYLGVVPLRQNEHGVSFAGDGAVIDYAVKMRRLSEAYTLQAMLRHEPLSETLMAALAERLAAFHRDHPLPSPGEGYGALEQARADWEENFRQTANGIGQTISQDAYDQIQDAVNAFMHHRADWFAQRVEGARIRDCHGDLRAEHIYVVEGAFQIIDCIEFNHRFRYIDVASEIAFLAMDLKRLGAPEAARLFVQAYVRASGDVELYRLLAFYACYRAYVRGKVASMRVETAPPDERQSLSCLAQSYFTQALGYAADLRQPWLLLTTGLIGTGKSTVANRLAAVLDVDVVSSDQVRKQLAGVSPQSSQRASYGQGLYGDEAKRRTYEAMTELARHALAQGQSVLLDASFAKRAERQRMLTLAHDHGARVCLIECCASESEIRARLKAREQAEATISDAREDILSDFQRDYEPVCERQWVCHARLDTTHEVEHCAQQALSVLHGF